MSGCFGVRGTGGFGCPDFGCLALYGAPTSLSVDDSSSRAGSRPSAVAAGSGEGLSVFPTKADGAGAKPLPCGPR